MTSENEETEPKKGRGALRTPGGEKKNCSAEREVRKKERHKHAISTIFKTNEVLMNSI